MVVRVPMAMPRSVGMRVLVFVLVRAFVLVRHALPPSVSDYRVKGVRQPLFGFR